MALTSQQKTTLKAAILADATLGPLFTAGASGVVEQGINTTVSPPFLIWSEAADVAAILNGVDGTKYTPSDTPALGDSQAQAALFLNRAHQILIKQQNLIMYTVGRQTLDCRTVGVRTALRDAVINVPAGASGANVSPGGASGVNVMSACVRHATFAEKALAGASTPLGTVQGNDATFIGRVTGDEVSQMMAGV